ncbi:glycosyltransferase family 2 protein [Nakamurella sp. GG22]
MTAPVQFSFLTTAYRTERYLPKTIESVRAQTYRDWEMVVVDNGNSDEMAAIVQSYAALDARIRLVRQENKGYQGGVMAAAAAARGRFVCVLDSDDQLLPEFCARINAVVGSDRSVDAVGIDAYRFNEPEDVNLPTSYMRSIGVKEVAHPSRRLTLAEVLGGRVPYYTAAIRREAWDAVGGYAPGIDDVDESVIIWCRLVDRFDVRLLPDQLARYRLRPDSLSREPAKVEAFERQLMRSFIEGARQATDPAHHAALESTLRKLRYDQSIRRARRALLDGDTKAARTSAKAAFTQRRTARSAALVTALAVCPGLLRQLHPAKRKVTDTVEHALGRLRQSPREERT